MIPKPLIGLTTYLQRAQTGVWDLEAALLPEVYVAAVQRAGGIPILLPPQPLEGGVAEQQSQDLAAGVPTGACHCH